MQLNERVVILESQVCLLKRLLLATTGMLILGGLLATTSLNQSTVTKVQIVGPVAVTVAKPVKVENPTFRSFKIEQKK